MALPIPNSPHHLIFDLVAEPVNPAPAAALFHSSADAMAPAMATVETKPAKEDRNTYFGNCMNEVSCDTYQYVQKYGVRIFTLLIISLLTYVSTTIDFSNVSAAPEVTTRRLRGDTVLTPDTGEWNTKLKVISLVISLGVSIFVYSYSCMMFAPQGFGAGGGGGGHGGGRNGPMPPAWSPENERQ